MGTGNLTERTDGQTIYASHPNEIRAALLTDLVPRNASGNPTTEAGSLGTSVYQWLSIRAKSLVVDGNTIDPAEISGASNRVISGAENSDGYPNFLDPAGVAGGLTGTILATTTNLLMVIDSADYSLASDIVIGSHTAAPTSNNTVTINEPTIDDTEDSKYIGEFDDDQYGRVINFDAGGSEIDTLTGTIQPFKHGSNPEVFYALISSAAGIGTLTPLDRGIAGTQREEFSDGDTITLLKAEHVFIDNDLTTTDKTIIYPTWSFTAPTGPATGQYWYKLSEQSWYRYSGSVWEQFGRLYLGSFINDGTDTLYVEHEDFSKGFKDDFHVKFERKDDDTITIVANSYLNVSGKLINWRQDTDIDLSASNIEGGAAELPTQRYWLYSSDDGQLIYSVQRPRLSLNKKMRYHPYKYWRCLLSCYNDGSSNIDFELDKTFIITNEPQKTDPEKFALLEKKYSTIVNGIEEIKSNKLLSDWYFPNTTGLYGWNINGSGSYDDGDWIGSLPLTEISGSSIGTDTGPIGDTVYCDFNGAADAIVNTTGLQDTGSFSFGIKFKPDGTSGPDTIAGQMFTGALSKRSWVIYQTSDSIRASVYYSADLSVDVATPSGILTPLVADGEWHDLGIVVNQANTSITIYLDRTVILHEVNANLANRVNHADAEFAIGARVNGVATYDEFFNGGLADAFYKTTALTPDEMRKALCSSCGEFCTIQNGQTYINGKQPVDMEISLGVASSLTSTSFTSIPLWDLYVPESSSRYVTQALVGLITLDNSGDGTAQSFLRIYDGSNGVSYEDYADAFFNVANTGFNVQKRVLKTLDTRAMYHAKDTLLELQYKVSSSDGIEINSGKFRLTKDM